MFLFGGIIMIIAIRTEPRQKLRTSLQDLPGYLEISCDPDRNIYKADSVAMPSSAHSSQPLIILACPAAHTLDVGLPMFPRFLCPA